MMSEGCWKKYMSRNSKGNYSGATNPLILRVMGLSLLCLCVCGLAE
jgi:hypothetical protein